MQNSGYDSYIRGVLMNGADVQTANEIINNPDSVRLEPDPDGSGRTALTFTKLIGNEYRTVLGYSNGKKGLVFDTMWAINKKGTSTTRSTTSQTASQEQTSETQRGYGANAGDTSPDFSIDKSAPNVNSESAPGGDRTNRGRQRVRAGKEEQRNERGMTFDA